MPNIKVSRLPRGIGHATPISASGKPQESLIQVLNASDNVVELRVTWIKL